MDSDDSRDAASSVASEEEEEKRHSSEGEESQKSRSPSPDNKSEFAPDSPASNRSGSSDNEGGDNRFSRNVKSPSGGASDRSRSSSPEQSEQQQQQQSRKSSSRSSSRSSRASQRSSRSSKRNKSNDGNSSDSSSASSVDSSSRRNKNVGKAQPDTMPEEISDGDMESDNEKAADKESESVSVVATPAARKEINISHEDLSDVSDLEDSIHSEHDEDEEQKKEDDLLDDKNSNVDNNSCNNSDKIQSNDKTRTEDGEEQLDFEAEDGECGEIIEPKTDEDSKKPKPDEEDNKKEAEAAKIAEKQREELEEGEVTDEDDVRPEETEPRPVCRFFSRGQCTWGASCRFLHPGVTDKGNYTMFEMIRPVVPGGGGGDYGRMDDRMYKGEAPPIESAWERGLRTAKEMLRKSVKRKEQDIDFEEKKMNLSLAQEEFDKENGYYGRVPSPEPRYVRHHPEYPPMRPPGPHPPPEEYYGRRQVLYEPEYAPPPPRERMRYRELPPHRMPDFYNNKYEKYEEEIPPPGHVGPGPMQKPMRRPPKREVIVQRVEEKQGRGDEWSDPWMRSKSPSQRRKDSTSGGRQRSYSSGSSYSSSSSSRSSSESSRSSYRSRSRSQSHRRGLTGRENRRTGRQVSPSVIVSERKAANERAALMNPPAPKRRAPSPGMMRVSASNPPAPSKDDQFGRRSKLAVAAALARVKGHRKSSRSSSGSSSGSSSDSDSSDTSSSSSREGSSPPQPPASSSRRSGMDSLAKAMDVLSGEKRQQIKLNLKNPNVRKESGKVETSAATTGKKRTATSPPPSDVGGKSKKSTSRREELLKQLKAVEDAIAKKRSRVN